MRPSSRLRPVLRKVILNQQHKFQSQSSHPARALSFTTHDHRHSPLRLTKPFNSTHVTYHSYSTAPHKPPSTLNMEATDSTKPESTKPESNNQAQPVTNPPPSLPALPPAGEGDSSSTLEVGGAALRMDHLGPLVVNEDGTMSRITNWEKMADIERENTVRILGKRNQMRLAKLRAAKEAQNDGDDKKAESDK